MVLSAMAVEGRPDLQGLVVESETRKLMLYT